MKDLRKSCHALGAAQHGNATVVVLAVIAVVVAGALGFVAGRNMKSNSLNHMKLASIVAPKDDGADVSGKNNPVVARVDGVAIKRQDVIDLMNSMPPQMRQIPQGQLYAIALEQAIGNVLADNHVKSSSLENDPEVQKQIWLARKQIIRANFVEKAVNARISDDKLKAEYDNYVKNFPKIEEVKAAHILVKDEKTAKDIIKKLDNGADFAELAKENSTDGSADNGGELGYFAENEVVPVFAKAAFAAKVGTYVKNPVKSEFGYHIIRVEDKRMRPPAPFDSVKPFIKQELARKELQTMLNEWKSAANIERFDINGNPIKQEATSNADNSDVASAATQPEAGAAADGGIEKAEPAAGDEKDTATTAE